MGKMSDYADKQRFKGSALRKLKDNYEQLLAMREDLTSGIASMTEVLHEMHNELTNVEYMIFEVKNKLEEEEPE